MKALISFSLLMLCVMAVHAQPVYKTVGPDGKITFSDEPPAEGKTTALDGYGPALPKVPEKSASERAAAASRIAGDQYKAKQAQAGSPAATPAPLDPALGQAIVGVLGFEDLVRQMEKLCTTTLPISFRKYGDAAFDWRQRNADILKQARSAMAGVLNADQRQKFEKVVEDKTFQMMDPIVKAPTASRIQWCDQSADEINSGKLDPQKKPAWVSALAQAR
ncbi:MAG: DUF4124 domain-containing protein [Moraxellaceae bacterium]